jgi:hypothetical protein
MKKSILFAFTFSLFLGSFLPIVGEEVVIAKEHVKNQEAIEKNNPRKKLELSEYRKYKFFERHFVKGGMGAKCLLYSLFTCISAGAGVLSLIEQRETEYARSAAITIGLFLLFKYFIIHRACDEQAIFDYANKIFEYEEKTPQEFYTYFYKMHHSIKRIRSQGAVPIIPNASKIKKEFTEKLYKSLNELKIKMLQDLEEKRIA